MCLYVQMKMCPHDRPGRRLNEDLQSWLNKSNSSVVYVSMGSIILSEHLPEEHLETFERVSFQRSLLQNMKRKKVTEKKGNYASPDQVFTKMNLRVIWKRSGESTENTFMTKWVTIYNLQVGDN